VQRNPLGRCWSSRRELQILELLDHKAIFTAGYKAVLHLHALVEECEVIELLQQIDPKTKKPMKKRPLFVKTDAVVVVKLQVQYTTSTVQNSTVQYSIELYCTV